MWHRAGRAAARTMMTLICPRACLVHVGETRAMYLHNGWLRPLTRDQTMGEGMVDAGAMTEEADVTRSQAESQSRLSLTGQVRLRGGSQIELKSRWCLHTGA